jgi:hypothetical protein
MFNFFWDRVSASWLMSRNAARLFGASAMVLTVATILLLSDVQQGSGPLSSLFWAIVGVSASLGAFFLWTGMLRFWRLWDTSSRAARRVWFVVLLIGVFYGAILYYALVYLRLRVVTSSSENHA